MLAFELDVDEDDLRSLYIKFSQEEINEIKHLAVKFNAKILGVQNDLDLATATNQQLITFLHHLKLQTRLGNGPNKDELLSILKTLEARYYNIPANDLSAFSEKAEIYNLLRFFKIKGFKAKGARHLIHSLEDVTKQIMQKPYGYYSQEDKQKITTVLKVIDDILGFKSSVQVNFYLRHKIYQAKRKIEKHISVYHALESFKQSRAKHLLFGTNNCPLESPVEFKQDIKPDLNLRSNQQRG